MTDSPSEANFGGRVLGCIEANCINGLFRSAYDPEWTVPDGHGLLDGPEWTVPDGHVLFRSADRKSPWVCFLLLCVYREEALETRRCDPVKVRERRIFVCVS